MRSAWEGVFILHAKLHSFDDEAVIGPVYLYSTVDTVNPKGYVASGIFDWT